MKAVVQVGYRSADVLESLQGLQGLQGLIPELPTW
jgi:hypothetical protein